MIVFGTGHRPEDTNHSRDEMVVLAVKALSENDPAIDVVVCGMAAGFDFAIALAAIQLEIPFWAARPWATHRARVADQELYAMLLQKADKVVNVSPVERYPGPWIYQSRNEWMVDVSDFGFAFWNGTLEGGTYNCLEYARKVKKRVFNLHPDGPHKYC